VHILAAATIRGWLFFRSDLPILRLLFEGSVYSKKYSKHLNILATQYVLHYATLLHAQSWVCTFTNARNSSWSQQESHESLERLFRHNHHKHFWLYAFLPVAIACTNMPIPEGIHTPDHHCSMKSWLKNWYGFIDDIMAQAHFISKFVARAVVG